MGDVRLGVPQAPPLPRLLEPSPPTGSLLTALHFLGILPSQIRGRGVEEFVCSCYYSKILKNRGEK